MVCPGSVCWGWVESRRWTSCNLGHNHGLDDVDDVDDGVGGLDDDDDDVDDDADDGVGGHDDVVGDDNHDRLPTKFRHSSK